MKKLMTILMASIVVVATIVSPAMAKKYKPAKTICWTFDSSSKSIAVYSKKGQSIRFATGKSDFYTLQGTQNIDGTWWPTAGSAYCPIPHYPLMVAHMTSDYMDFYSFEIYWDIEDETGAVYVYTGSTGGETYYDDLVEVDCETVDPLN